MNSSKLISVLFTNDLIKPTCCRCKLLVDWKSHNCTSNSKVNTVSNLERLVNDSSTYPLPCQEPITSLHCSKCGITLSNEEEFNKHKMIHQGRFRCDQCSFTCEHEQWLQVHKKVHFVREMQDAPVVETCRLCSYQTTSKAHMQQHTNTHIGNRPYNCKICSFSSSNMSNMYRHIRGKHKIYDLEILKSSISVSEGRFRHDMINFQETVDSLCTSQPNPSHRSVDVRERHSDMLGELKSSTSTRASLGTLLHTDKVINCDRCYYTCKDKADMATHKEFVHNIESVELVSSDDSQGPSGSKSASAPATSCYLEKLADIVRSANTYGESDWTLSDVNYSVFRIPPYLIPQHSSALTVKDFHTSSSTRIDGKIVNVYKCRGCGWKSYERKQMIQHIEVSHMNTANQLESSRSYYCQHCLYKTESTSSLRYHYDDFHPNIDMTKVTNQLGSYQCRSNAAPVSLSDGYSSSSTASSFSIESPVGLRYNSERTMSASSVQKEYTSSKISATEHVSTPHKVKISAKVEYLNPDIPISLSQTGSNHKFIVTSDSSMSFSTSGERVVGIHRQSVKTSTTATNSNVSTGGHVASITHGFIDPNSIEIVSDSDDPDFE